MEETQEETEDGNIKRTKYTIDTHESPKAINSGSKRISAPRPSNQLSQISELSQMSQQQSENVSFAGDAEKEDGESEQYRLRKSSRH